MEEQDKHIEWYNAQPNRKACPDCQQLMYAGIGSDGGITIKIDHKDDCSMLPKAASFKEDFKRRWGWDL